MVNINNLKPLHISHNYSSQQLQFMIDTDTLTKLSQEKYHYFLSLTSKYNTNFLIDNDKMIYTIVMKNFKSFSLVKIKESFYKNIMKRCELN